MRPTEAEGVYTNLKLSDKVKLEGGWIYKISPRSTVQWYSVAHSIGVNSQGVNVDGSPGDYAGNIQSKGVGIIGLTLKPSAGVQLKALEQVTQNVFHTTLLQADFQQKERTLQWIGAVQYIRQGAVGEGGNPDAAKKYFDPQNKVNILGLKAGVENGGWETTANYTRIFKGGRFTMPREWGIEPLFTTLPRERSEGTGDVHAFMVQAKGKVLKERLKLEAGYGHYYLPGYDHAALNKYGMPSYRHVKLLGDYSFGGQLQGLNLVVLAVYKGRLGSPSAEHKYVINKVDMSSYNLILNYNF